VTSGVTAAATQVGCPAEDWNPAGCAPTAETALRLASRSLDAEMPLLFEFGCAAEVSDELRGGVCDPVRAERGAWLKASSALLRSADGLANELLAKMFSRAAARALEVRRSAARSSAVSVTEPPVLSVFPKEIAGCGLALYLAEDVSEAEATAVEDAVRVCTGARAVAEIAELAAGRPVAASAVAARPRITSSGATTAAG
jgi:hypothetical protein